jgi:hypothetical protein
MEQHSVRVTGLDTCCYFESHTGMNKRFGRLAYFAYPITGLQEFETHLTTLIMPAHPAAPSRPSGPAHRNLR